MQKFKWFLLSMIIIATAFAFTAPAGNGAKEKIHWITLRELNEQYYKNPKPILIDVYTDWCGWCKQMDRTTYQNSKLAAYVNEKYYAVRFDAESTDTVFFNKQKFAYNPTIKANELAMYLTFGRLEFPHTIFLSSLDARPAPLSGYMKPKEMEAPMKFFGEKAEANQTFVEFNKTMKKEW